MVFSDLRRLQDRLASTEKGTITSVQAIYVPADDLSDPAVQAISQQLDSVLVLDPGDILLRHHRRSWRQHAWSGKDLS
jgi:F-type H+-transporting ATPase subunit beta